MVDAKNPLFKIEILHNILGMDVGQTAYVWEENEREIFFYNKRGAYTWIEKDLEGETWKRV